LALLTFLIVRNIQKNGQKQNTATTTVSQLNSTSSYKVIDANNFNDANLGKTTTTQLPVKKFTAAEATQNTVKQFAKIFIERYGSYSTDNNGQNVLEVKEMVTADLWSKIKPKTLGKTNNGFLGMSTEVISAEMAKWSDTEAVVKLKTVRSQEKNKVTSTLQQGATVTLVKQGNAWLVNSFVWE
jgi:hypothetical protein